MRVPKLKNFLAQSITEDIRRKSYNKEYRNFNVKISFGKGRASNVPWIAFLKGDNEIRREIYPASFHYKHYNLIITCFAIGSYTTQEKSKWIFPDNFKVQTIRESKFNIPYSKLHYGNSFVHKSFIVNDDLDISEVIESLNVILEIYNKYNEQTNWA